MFKPYQTVMALNVKVNDVYCDFKCTFIGLNHRGSKKGLYKVQLNGNIHYMELSKLMDFDEYMKIFNDDKSKLPEIAAKKLFFLEGIKL